MSAPPPTRSAAADGVHGEVISDRNLVDGENLRYVTEHGDEAIAGASCPHTASMGAPSNHVSWLT